MRSEFHASHQIHFQFFTLSINFESSQVIWCRNLSKRMKSIDFWLCMDFNAIFVYFFCEWITVNIAFTICFLHLQVDSISISISVHFFHFQSQSHCFRPDNSCRNLSIFHGANIIHTKKYAILHFLEFIRHSISNCSQLYALFIIRFRSLTC